MARSEDPRSPSPVRARRTPRSTRPGDEQPLGGGSAPDSRRPSIECWRGGWRSPALSGTVKLVLDNRPGERALRCAVIGPRTRSLAWFGAPSGRQPSTVCAGARSRTNSIRRAASATSGFDPELNQLSRAVAASDPARSPSPPRSGPRPRIPQAPGSGRKRADGVPPFLPVRDCGRPVFVSIRAGSLCPFDRPVLRGNGISPLSCHIPPRGRPDGASRPWRTLRPPRTRSCPGTGQGIRRGRSAPDRRPLRCPRR